MPDEDTQPKRREKPDVGDFENPNAGKTTTKKAVDGGESKTK